MAVDEVGVVTGEVGAEEVRGAGEGRVDAELVQQSVLRGPDPKAGPGPCRGLRCVGGEVGVGVWGGFRGCGVER